MQNQKHILIIDDEQDILDVLGDKIRQSGFRVSSANSGGQGLERAMGEHPDLILLDIMMPATDGWAVLEALRADEWGKSARVMILTNLEDAQSAARAMEFGVYDFLVKTDWQLDDIVQRIEKKLGE